MMNSQFKRGLKHYENVKSYFISRCIAYLCYHLYTYGPGLFNVTVMIIFLLSVVANYFRYRKENEMKANEASRQARAQAKHDRKHKHARES